MAEGGLDFAHLFACEAQRLTRLGWLWTHKARAMHLCSAAGALAGAQVLAI